MKEANESLTEAVIGCAIEVHRALGPGLLESAYERCLAHELGLQGIAYKSQVPVPIKYKGISLECGFRLDVLVDDCLIIELKAVDKLTKVYEAQMLTYLKLTGISTGLLLNFNVSRLVDGLKRYKR